MATNLSLTAERPWFRELSNPCWVVLVRKHKKFVSIYFTNGKLYDVLTRELCLGTFTEQELGEINFREISTPILEKVIQYFYYNLRYSNSTVEIPEFEVQPEIALELLMAANFLGA